MKPGRQAFDTGGPQGPPPTSSPEKSESGGGGAVDLAAMLESALKEARRHVNNPAAPHAKWMCMFSIGQTEALLARVRVLEAALTRIASSEGFEGAGVLDHSFAGRECRARMRYAEAALAAAGGGDRHE